MDDIENSIKIYPLPIFLTFLLSLWPLLIQCACAQNPPSRFANYRQWSVSRQTPTTEVARRHSNRRQLNCAHAANIKTILRGISKSTHGLIQHKNLSAGESAVLTLNTWTCLVKGQFSFSFFVRTSLFFIVFWLNNALSTYFRCMMLG